MALLSDTRMRLGRVVGLAVEDVHLDDETPYIILIPLPWRGLKKGTG